MSASPNNDSLRAKRKASLKLAVSSSAVSKATALGLHAIALPLVYHSLGVHDYALYVLISGVLSTITLLQMGAGPGLTRELAKANAREDRASEAALFQSTLLFSFVAALVAAAVLMILVRAIPPRVLFGDAFAEESTRIVRITTVAALLLVVHIVLGVVDSARAAYQEQVYTGVSSSVVNVVTTGVLGIVCMRASSITLVLFVIYGLPASSRLANLVLLLWGRPHLIRVSRPRSADLALLVQTGIGFWVVQLAGLVEQNAGAFVLAHVAGPQAVDVFAIAYRMCSLAGAAAGTITQPLWPSFTEAMVRRDGEWVRTVFAKVKRTMVGGAFFLAIGFALAGPWLSAKYIPANAQPSTVLIVILAVYLLANIWTHLHYVTLMGISDLWSVSAVIVFENCAMVLLGLLFASTLGALGMALGYLCASVLLPVWWLPLRVKNVFRSDAQVTASAALANS